LKGIMWTYLILVINKFGKVSTLRCRLGCRWRVCMSLLRREPLNIVIKRWGRRDPALGIIIETAALINAHRKNVAVGLAVFRTRSHPTRPGPGLGIDPFFARGFVCVL
jgi:hypothetical protein